MSDQTLGVGEFLSTLAECSNCKAVITLEDPHLVKGKSKRRVTFGDVCVICGKGKIVRRLQ